MKPTTLLAALLALPLLAQTNWHGVRIGQAQSAEFITAQPSAGDPASAPAIAIQFETWVEQLPSQHIESVSASFTGIEKSAGKSVLRRLVRDNFRNVQVRYALTVEAGPAEHHYRVTLDDVPEAQGPSAAALKEWKLLSPTTHFAPQIVQTGELLKLDLYTSSHGVKLVEYVRIGEPSRQPLRVESARDAFADDAEFTIASPTFKVNGVRVSSKPAAELHGAVLRVRVPGFGSYVLSLKPHPERDFESAGEVSGNALVFLSRGNLVRIECKDRIAPGSGRYNVYSFFDAAEESVEGSSAGIGLVSGVL